MDLFCPVRGATNACRKCGAGKTCAELVPVSPGGYGRHGHTLLCRRCNYARQFDECACGARKKKRSLTCMACYKVPQGEDHHLYKEGKSRSTQGYILCVVPGHPGSRGKGGGTVAEHRLVMESMLGRYLLPQENVHHRNGIRDDNRPENLELWVRPQPSGIRARDALAWAREIVALYDGVDLP